EVENELVRLVPDADEVRVHAGLDLGRGAQTQPTRQWRGLRRRGRAGLAHSQQGYRAERRVTGGAGDGTMIRCNRWRGGRALDEFTDPDGGFTYPEVGATASRPLPSGYRHLSYRTRVGPASAMPAAAEAILGWRLHRSLGIGFDVSAPRAAPGVRATTRLGVGRLAIQAPCRVVWTVSEPERAGFAYGTL